jgi:hypothetical protein
MQKLSTPDWVPHASNGIIFNTERSINSVIPWLLWVSHISQWCLEMREGQKDTSYHNVETGGPTSPLFLPKWNILWQIGPLLGDEEVNMFQPTHVQQ